MKIRNYVICSPTASSRDTLDISLYLSPQFEGLEFSRKIRKLQCPSDVEGIKNCLAQMDHDVETMGPEETSEVGGYTFNNRH